VEAGLATETPRPTSGQLMNALLRNARYLSAIGLHTKGKTLANRNVSSGSSVQDPANARQQAARARTIRRT